ncbi:MAG: DAK2 domain-containing protein, partial [Vulcanimicrobiaceae bacterium]
MLTVTALDGEGFSRFVAAGTYFLRKYRGVLNDLNVFPVPDGDTGSNLYVTVKAALLEAARVKGQPLSVVAAAAASGALLGARGNSGVIFSQLLRGFAHSVRHRERIDTFQLAVAMKDAVAAARDALLHPVEGTMLSVATAAAEEAYHTAPHENEFHRMCAAIVRAANDALERTPEQLPLLREAGVVDSGGAGLVYFLEGILRFLPPRAQRATAYPRRAIRVPHRAHRHDVGPNKFCTEFVLTNALVEAPALRELLRRRGDSLLVAGDPPMLRVHLHTDDPDRVQAVAREHGTIDRLKVDDMAEQHRVLLVEVPKRAVSFLAIVPGLGFDRIVRELGSDESIVAEPGSEPSTDDIVLAIRKCTAPVVVVLASDPPTAVKAHEARGRITEKDVRIAPTSDIASTLAVLVACGGRVEEGPAPGPGELEEAVSRVRSTAVNGRGNVEVAALDAARALVHGETGLLTLY